MWNRRKSMLDSLADDIREHIERETQDNIDRGMPADEARFAAIRKFGNPTRVAEDTREVWTMTWLENFLLDARHGLRLLARNRAFAIAAIVTLAVGIGANTAIFSVVHAILLKPLPYPHADRLAIIWTGLSEERRAPASKYELLQMRQNSKSFEEIGGIWITNGTVPGSGEPEQVKVGFVTTNFLSLLSSEPAAGRFFSDDDAKHEDGSNVVISYGLWQRRFGGDPQVLGKVLRNGDYGVTIIGVLPRDFRLILPSSSALSDSVDIFMPVSFAEAPIDGPGYLKTIGRLAPGVTVAQAQAELDGVAERLRATVPDFAAQKMTLSVFPMQADGTRDVRSALLLLFAGVALVVLIACVNVANLLLARSSYRLRETSIRATIGASRGRLMRQLLAESFVLGLAGGAAAMGVAWLAVRGLIALRPESLARLGTIELSGTVFAYALLLSLATVIVFGLAPAVFGSRVDLSGGMKAGSGVSSRSSGRYSRAALVAAEVALSVVLLAATGLLMRTFTALLRVNPGFTAENALTFTTTPGGYKFAHAVQSKLLEIPGVESASASSHLPLDSNYANWYDGYYKEGAPPEDQNTNLADDRSILPGYFQTIGATLISGRDFNESDDAAHEHVAIIDDELAAREWPGQSALGKKLNISDSPKGFYEFERDWVVVVGVVKHVQYHSLTTSVRPQIYVPFQLAPRPISYVVRASMPEAALRAAIRAKLDEVDKSAPMARVVTLGELADQARAQSRFVAYLASALAGIALLLACVGIAGVTSYSVAQRTNEIGLRMALGASANNVLKMIVDRNLAPVAAGLAFGLASSLALTPLLESLLFGVRPQDPLTLAVVAIVVAATGVAACYIPARRATHVDPMVALRHE
ncbi:MAG: ABC transporter permease [Candidatus Acidiferrales bacterium]